MVLRKIFFLSVILVVTSTCFAGQRLIVIDQPYFAGLRQATDAIRMYGGHPQIVVYPRFIIADIPDDALDEVLAHLAVRGVYETEVEPSQFAEFGKVGPHLAQAWNNVYMGKSLEMGLDEEPSQDRKPLINDAFYVDDPMLLMKPPGSRYYDTSDFMLGNVAVGFILPESDGSIDPDAEDWTQTEMDNVTSEVINGLNWYVTQADYRPLTFYTVFHYQVPTSYEPITRPSTDEALWRDECLNNLGYAHRYEYVRAIRDSFNADWGVLALVVDDTNDADNAFANGAFAYSYLGGPNLVMTYDNDGWGIANMDAVLAHEISHSFFALDEYYEAGEPCGACSGYLNVENQNSEYPDGPGGCETNKIFCIMRSVSLSAARVCYYTKGQIGWWDSDGDSLPDIIDTCPETVLYPYSPDPCSTFTPTYAGSSWVTMLPNENPRDSHPNDVTINRILKVEYRIDGASWHEALPNDGAWDEGKEGFHFTTDPLTEGTHIIEARAFHTYGNYDTTYAADTLTVQGGSSGADGSEWQAFLIEASPNPFGPSVEISYSVPGTYGQGVPVSLKVFDIKGRQVAVLLEAVRSPGPGRLSWDGTNAHGSDVPSGIYFIEFTAGDMRTVSKVAIVR